MSRALSNVMKNASRSLQRRKRLADSIVMPCGSSIDIIYGSRGAVLIIVTVSRKLIDWRGRELLGRRGRSG